ncbi:ParA family protein [Listeria booriae]|uniref:ParA family protein n=1 Tax=Listeria booriae TaxID=1552123 RepID=A0A7X0ZR67_9LIST|nr:ParA family protein [Listeria booriae]MBC1228601.1 ParA family protein [Listeria booriae]MBC1567190.1 ParA family protein [Listeria booriae]MBC1798487.1 ParA family protein [Listeria booriae]MBC2164625.1 ParA family protein [Listeria booriae]MBC2266176.1 ParA family protein [Listeria booriae]
MAIKIAFTNYKGGTAKTTSSTNLAGGLLKTFPDAKILLVEADGQGNTSSTFSIKSSTIENTMYDVMLKDVPMKDIVINAYENIDIAPANSDMDFVDFDFMTENKREMKVSIFQALKKIPNLVKRILTMKLSEFLTEIDKEIVETKDYFNLLKDKLDDVDAIYDFIIFDTPPEMKAVTASTLAVVDHVIIPYEPEKYSVEGIVRLLRRINTIRNEYNPSLNIAGLLPVKVNMKTKLHNEVMASILQFSMNQKINHFSTRIPASIRFATATANGLPATIVDKRTEKFTEAYYELIDELIEKEIIK